MRWEGGEGRQSSHRTDVSLLCAGGYLALNSVVLVGPPTLHYHWIRGEWTWRLQDNVNGHHTDSLLHTTSVSLHSTFLPLLCLWTGFWCCSLGLALACGSEVREVLRLLSILPLGLASLESVIFDPSLKWGEDRGGMRGRGRHIYTNTPVITRASSSSRLWWDFLPTCHPLIPTPSTGQFTSCGLLTTLPTQRAVEVM